MARWYVRKVLYSRLRQCYVALTSPTFAMLLLLVYARHMSAAQGKALSQEERSRTVAQVLQYCISQFPDRAQLQKWFQEVGQRLVRVTWQCWVF